MDHRYRMSSFTSDLVWISAAVAGCGAAVYAAVDVSFWLAPYFVAGLAFCAWYGLCRHIQEIRLSDGGVCEFRTLLRRDASRCERSSLCA